MKRFEYFAPTDVSEALRLLDTFEEEAKLLAGGTDLLLQMKNNVINPGYLVGLKKIRELSGIDYSSREGIRLRPLTTISEVESSETIGANIPILAEAARTLGSVQIRNWATVGGNICRAAPSADLVPALIVLGAELKIKCSGAERLVSMEDFFAGVGKTILNYNEILTEIKIPVPSSSAAGVYIKYGPRQTMDLAVVGVAVFIILDPINDTCKSVKIALESVAPTPLRAKKAEKVLLGEKLSQTIIEETAKIASEETSPITDVYGPEWYKREIAEVLVKRAVWKVMHRIRNLRDNA